MVCTRLYATLVLLNETMYLLEKEAAVRLYHWYSQNKRDLPWRDTGNPFDVWISEVMLQQTRVEAVRDYFLRFKERITSIEELSLIEDEQLLRLWEGLGYYSRARNLKKSAKIIVEQYGGEIPKEKEELLMLPGIGPYTAGAILSIAYGKAVPAIDGNVLRVLARYFSITEDIRKDTTRKKMEDIISFFYQENTDLSSNSVFVSSFTQALMELGALLCLPVHPICERCPLKESCSCYNDQLQEQIPCRSRLKERKKIDRTLLIIRSGDHFLLQQRKKKGLLQGMYEFIGIDHKLNQEQILEQIQEMRLEALHIRRLPSSVHIFSHLEWHMDAYEISIADIEENKGDWIIADRNRLKEMALPSAFKAYIDYYSLRETENL